MTVDEYEQKFHSLCYFAVNFNITNEARLLGIFGNGLRDEIKAPKAEGLYMEYSSQVESVYATERFAPKPKPKEAPI